MNPVRQGAGPVEDLVGAVLRGAQEERGQLALQGAQHGARLDELEATLGQLAELARTNEVLAGEAMRGVGELAAGHEAHNRRLGVLEEGARVSGERLAAAQAERAALNGRVDDVRENVGQLRGRVDAQAQRVNGLQRDVIGLQGQAQAMGRRIEFVEGAQERLANAQAQADVRLQVLQGRVDVQVTRARLQQEAINAAQAQHDVERAAVEARMNALQDQIGNQQEAARDADQGLQNARVDAEALREKAKWQAIGAGVCAVTPVLTHVVKLPFDRRSESLHTIAYAGCIRCFGYFDYYAFGAITYGGEVAAELVAGGLAVSAYQNYNAAEEQEDA